MKSHALLQNIHRSVKTLSSLTVINNPAEFRGPSGLAFAGLAFENQRRTFPLLPPGRVRIQNIHGRERCNNCALLNKRSLGLQFLEIFFG
jgi:hypothetical protein